MNAKNFLPKNLSYKQLLFASAVTLGLVTKPHILAQTVINSKIYRDSEYSKKSFITEAIEKTGPSVVTIDTQKFIRQKKFPKDSRIFIDPYFDKFFNLPLPYENKTRVEQNQGSGFIFDDGLVITNAHVVNGSEKLIVGLSNGKKFRGKLIGQDLITDLAIIRLEGTGPWPKAILGDSKKVKVGDWAIAVGNPYGLENTVTLGIISNLNRNVSQLGIYDRKFELIQTDAAINPGNSGGPLLNSSGEVIGINTLIRSGPGAGLSFAIPINKAKDIAYQLIQKGEVVHPMIGISLIDSIELENKNSVKVAYVVPNSPAYQSGIIVNDIILKVADKMIQNSSQVTNEISKNGVNKFVSITLKRGNKLIRIKVKPTDIKNL